MRDRRLRHRDDRAHVEIERRLVELEVELGERLPRPGSRPALLTRMSSRPSAATAASTTSAPASARARSPCTATAVPPPSRIAATTASAASRAPVVMHRDRRPEPAEPGRHRRADAGARAGHQRPLAANVLEHRLPPAFLLRAEPTARPSPVKAARACGGRRGGLSLRHQRGGHDDRSQGRPGRRARGLEPPAAHADRRPVPARGPRPRARRSPRRSREACAAAGCGLIFKSSYDKANRTSRRRPARRRHGRGPARCSPPSATASAARS